MYLKWLSEKLNLKSFEDWRAVSYDVVCKHRGFTLLKKHGSFLEVVQKFMPQPSWKEKEINRPQPLAKAQTIMLKQLKEILLGHEDIEESHFLVNYKHPELLFSSTNKPMELDVFVSSKNLAFEYHGEQHYGVHFLFGNADARQQRDKEKLLGCQKIGITLIIVPYWWNQSKESLMATIRQIRPELIPQEVQAFPIPLKPPN